MTFIATDKGGGLRRLLDFVSWGLGLKSKLEKKKILATLLVQIEASAQEVRESITKLKLRYNHLLKQAITAIVQKENDRALIYANEAAQVKRMVMKLVVVDKVLEQVKLRLETIENVSNISTPMIETANMLALARDYIKDVVPSMAYSIDSLISETKKVLTETTDAIEINPEVAIEYTPDAKRLLNELEKVAAETVRNQLPDIPLGLMISGKGKGLEVRVKETAVKIAAAPKVRIRRPKPEDIDKEVLEYILTHGGFIDVGDVAARLGVGKKEVMESLHRLREQNKIAF